MLCIALTLSACSFQQQPEAMVADTQEATAVRPFPIDTLYTLLAAELAEQRGQNDIALANYMQQAYKTRDVAVTRQATLLAQHLQAGQATLDAALLWEELEPNNPEPLYIVGQYLIAAKKTDMALDRSEKLLTLKAQTLFLPIAVAARDGSDEQRVALQKRYTTLLASNKKSIDLLLGMAALQEQQADYTSSLSNIEKAQSLDKKQLQARLFEVDVLYKSGRPDKAIKRLAGIVADYPDNEKMRLQYARLLSEQDLTKAREQFDYLAKANSLEPDLLLARALVNYQLKDNVQAQDLFEQLLFLKKHVNTAHYYLGEIALADKKIPMAIEHFRRVEGDSEYLPSLIRTFDLMIEQNQRLEGQTYLMEQREKHPELVMRLYLIEADVLMQHGDYPRSLAALNEAIKKNPDAVELYYARSLLHEKLDNVTAAEQDLRHVLAEQPDNVDALNALGYVLADKTEHLDESHQLISKALALRPDDPAIMDSMGWVLYRQGNLNEALLRLKRAYALYPMDEVAAHLGEVLWVSGDKKAADKIWKQGIKDKPDSDIIRTTRKRLQAP
jgi:tetratricopeptide (TPR) repeat protein